LLENNQPVILAKGEGNPITPPTNRGPSNVHRLLEFDLASLQREQEQILTELIVQRRKQLIQTWVPELIQLAQVGAVKLLNFMISVLFQKTKNHKNQKILIMIIVKIQNRIKIKKRSEETRT
jgi:hypothetical protein